MCLIAFAWKIHPAYPLVLAANRDEFHHRPTQDMHWWPDQPDILAGRDLQAGGTWLAISRSGRMATVTNYREQSQRRSAPCSRGELVTDFSTSKETPENFSRAINGDRYAGFSLLTAVDDQLCYVSNCGDETLVLEPGIYGLSNASLDAPWSKLLRTRESLRQIVAANRINETELLRLMGDRQVASFDDVPTGPLPFEMSRALTAPFIVTPDYGTRCTTVLLRNTSGKTSVYERRFDATGKTTGESRFSFELTQGAAN